MLWGDALFLRTFAPEMNVTSIANTILSRRRRAMEAFDTHAEELQMKVLGRLTQRAAHTEWGSAHGYAGVRTYDDFARSGPVETYDTLKSHIERMRHGERDVLWPGRVRWYAKSSGTTNDKSKFIPVSPDALRDTHYAGGRDSVATYLAHRPHSRVLDGKGLILGGSHAPNYNLRHSLVGDLSAILIENLNPLVNYVRVPSKRTALLPDFEVKRERIAREAIGRNVASISGVPSWLLAVLHRVLELTGCATLDEVWPNLEVFWHGGVAFTPYREQYRRIIRRPDMCYQETYNASEGFFGLQNDLSDRAMLLLIDFGVFFEFIPLDELESERPTVLPLWGVETGRNYAMVISTSSGLWRYLIGDTVRFTQRNPYKFVITGRTKSFINAFGEELIVDNAEHALAHACAATGAEIHEYTAAPVFMDGEAHCRHQWLIEFTRPPADIDAFATALDQELQRQNSDYEAKRAKDITLQRPEVIVARRGLFTEWLARQGKLGGQHKVPRLNNSRRHIDELLALQTHTRT